MRYQTRDRLVHWGVKYNWYGYLHTACARRIYLGSIQSPSDKPVSVTCLACLADPTWLADVH